MAREPLVACKCFCSGNPTGSFHCGHPTKVKGTVLLWRPQLSILLFRWIFISKSWRLSFRKGFFFIFHWPTFFHSSVTSCYIYPSSCHSQHGWTSLVVFPSQRWKRRRTLLLGALCTGRGGETCSAEGKQRSRLSTSLLSKICNLIVWKCHWLEGGRLPLRVFKVC